MTKLHKEKHKVSILIPVYNRESMVQECIQSALNQTYKNIEIVLVDNASTDETWEVCQKWAERDARIRIFRNKENIGPVGNWLRCAELACGEYSKLLFSDDLLTENCIKEMVEIISTSDEIAFVYSSVMIGKSPQQAKLNYLTFNNDKVFTSSKYISLVLNGAVPVSPCAILLRTKDLRRNIVSFFPTAKKHNFYAHGAGSDLMLLLLTADEYKKIYFKAKPLVFFRAHDGSISISDKGGEVGDGYKAIICYYLKNNSRVLSWYRYVASLWIKEMLDKKKILKIREFSVNFEGKGTCIESTFLFVMAFYALFRGINRTILKIVYKKNLFN